MIAAILFTVSIVAFAQFGLYYWRATISGVASHAVSDRIRVAAGISAASVGGHDFHSILILKDLSPDLRGPSGSFRTLRVYYAIVEKLGSFIPAMANWSNVRSTLVVCSCDSVTSVGWPPISMVSLPFSFRLMFVLAIRPFSAS